MALRGTRLVGALGVVVVVLDQLTKAWVRDAYALGEGTPLIDGVVWLTRVHNTGAAFGMLRGKQWLLAAFAVVVLVAIGWIVARVKHLHPLVGVGLGLVAGGAAGNLIDRVVLSGVTDFIDFGWFPVFNVADIALDVGVALIVIWLLFFDGREHAAQPASHRGAPTTGQDPL